MVVGLSVKVQPEIVVGARYDAERLQDGTLSQGAVDDGASRSVILVRVAEALRQRPPSMRVKVVWFDMEEVRVAWFNQLPEQSRGQSDSRNAQFRCEWLRRYGVIWPASASVIRDCGMRWLRPVWNSGGNVFRSHRCLQGTTDRSQRPTFQRSRSLCYRPWRSTNFGW